MNRDFNKNSLDHLDKNQQDVREKYLKMEQGLTSKLDIILNSIIRIEFRVEELERKYESQISAYKTQNQI